MERPEIYNDIPNANTRNCIKKIKLLSSNLYIVIENI